jgi:hypothetical protein
MRNVLVLCDHAKSTCPPDQFDVFQEVNQYLPDRNMRLQAWHVSHYLLSPLDSVARDLLDIAAFVYHADGSIRRGTEKDLFNRVVAQQEQMMIN